MIPLCECSRACGYVRYISVGLFVVVGVVHTQSAKSIGRNVLLLAARTGEQPSATAASCNYAIKLGEFFLCRVCVRV